MASSISKAKEEKKKTVDLTKLKDHISRRNKSLEKVPKEKAIEMHIFLLLSPNEWHKGCSFTCA
ncbi:hypothetical protein MA16_Dca000409 [Dendrobium catenatum]|uniref:Uncharacterized protein n=1 Tax=Dendrobium catenatum TaxID=906689 RepID=A0A2I0WTS8_9ASPA|nr:hypothetical protein MA16_Dca000409 [Dendrobium catenatum]